MKTFIRSLLLLLFPLGGLLGLAAPALAQSMDLTARVSSELGYDDANFFFYEHNELQIDYHLVAPLSDGQNEAHPIHLPAEDELQIVFNGSWNQHEPGIPGLVITVPAGTMTVIKGNNYLSEEIDPVQSKILVDLYIPDGNGNIEVVDLKQYLLTLSVRELVKSSTESYSLRLTWDREVFPFQPLPFQPASALLTDGDPTGIWCTNCQYTPVNLAAEILLKVGAVEPTGQFQYVGAVRPTSQQVIFE